MSALIILGIQTTGGHTSVGTLALSQFMMTLGLIMGDTMADALGVEYEQRCSGRNSAGTVQNYCYSVRFGAELVGSICGAFLYNHSSWGWGLSYETICFSLAILMACALPVILLTVEVPPEEIPTCGDQLKGMFNTMKLRAAWKPMLYIFSYNMLQIPNAAWNTFLVDGLNFSNFELGMITVISSLAQLLGLMTYKWFFMETSWRLNYIITTMVGLAFSLLSLVLVLRGTKYIGIGDFGFAAGDTVFIAFVGGIQFMPCVLIALALCPKGQEATTFAVFTTFANLGGSVGSALGNGLVRIWDCSNNTVKAGDYSGVRNLLVLTSIIQVVPIFWVKLLPHGREDLVKLTGSYFWFGVFFVTLFFVALTSVVFDSFYEMLT
eukprot:TRINITY_DN16764_c0_g1_i1.p1 TRINITY_DN16764_c0_g1~~TRINITY_DN16764_c0_g1_i1.p1  ORF type:complete len:379 (+),score=50.27 TRINITY_DN16764_c0_g1_i1:207-1343(+)